MTPQALYDRAPSAVTHDLFALHGFSFDHVSEASLDWWRMRANERVTVRTIEDHVLSCGRRIWRLATVWFDALPVMVIQNAGREGDDHVRRFITDEAWFHEMIIYLRSLVVHEDPDIGFTHEVANEVLGLDEFYGHKLGEPWT